MQPAPPTNKIFFILWTDLSGYSFFSILNFFRKMSFDNLVPPIVKRVTNHAKNVTPLGINEYFSMKYEKNYT